MKNTLLGMAVLVLSAAAAYGQSRYDIPFNFRVGEKTFTAGKFTVAKVNDRGTLSPVWVRAETGNQSIALLPQCAVQLAKAPDSSTLLFHRYGNVYYLSQIWAAGSGEGMQLAKSRSERETARAGAPTQIARVYAAIR